MKKLSDRGITSIEVLLCFVIASGIVISMFKVIDAYKDRTDLESYKSTITTYKNTLTKTIEDAIISNRGIYNAEVIENNNEEHRVPDNEYWINLTFKNGKEIKMKVVKKTYCTATGKICDSSSKTDDELDYDKSSFYVEFDGEKISLPKVYALQFNEVYLKNEDGFVTLHIGLHHPDLGNKYDALNIISPLVSTYPNALGL